MMKVMLVAALVAVCVQVVMSSTVACKCNRILNHVCGTDGKTYDNDCLRICNGTDLAHEGECGSTVEKRDAELCPCPLIILPVCGIDGNTYDNDCLRNCSGTVLDHVGTCGSPVGVFVKREAELCKCSFILLHVCGEDGNTYNNDCLRNCSGTELAHEGKCTTVEKREAEHCPCPFILVHVCGIDGVTYDNDCLRNCSGTGLDHVGKCGSPVEVFEKREAEHCPCPFILVHVCGKDGVTYDNDCLRNCSGTDLDHVGKCGSPVEVFAKREAESCKCSFILLHVCGTDGKTYNNDCLRNCSGTELAHEGKCTTVEKREAEHCPCPFILAHVCGKDGVTYDNDCLRNCSGTEQAHEGKCLPVESRDGAPCDCPNSEEPVCGTNGQTFANDCVRVCSGVDKQDDGPCDDGDLKQLFKREDVICKCPRTNIPVCGTDGETYPNLCELLCRGATFAYEGDCTSA